MEAKLGNGWSYRDPSLCGTVNFICECKEDYIGALFSEGPGKLWKCPKCGRRYNVKCWIELEEK